MSAKRVLWAFLAVVGMCSGLVGTILGFTPLYFVLFGPRSYKAAIVAAGGLSLVLVARYISKNVWRVGPASETQKAVAQDLGVEYRSDISAGALSDLIKKARTAE